MEVKQNLKQKRQEIHFGDLLSRAIHRVGFIP